MFYGVPQPWSYGELNFKIIKKVRGMCLGHAYKLVKKTHVSFLPDLERIVYNPSL